MYDKKMGEKEYNFSESHINDTSTFRCVPFIAKPFTILKRHGMGLNTGINLESLVDSGELICQLLNKKTESKVARAILAKRQT